MNELIQRGEKYYVDSNGNFIGIYVDGAIPPQGAVEIDSIPKPTLSQLKDEKRAEIKQAYLEAADAAVALDAIVWDGGFESAIKLDAAMRLSEAAGADGVIFYDSDNVSHALNFDDALDVCIGVAVAYQTALGIKQKLYSDIEKATTVAAVNKIKWPSND
jgi:hypothetical protein